MAPSLGATAQASETCVSHAHQAKSWFHLRPYLKLKYIFVVQSGAMKCPALQRCFLCNDCTSIFLNSARVGAIDPTISPRRPNGLTRFSTRKRKEALC